MYKIVKTPDALNSFVEEFKDLLHQTCRIKSDKKIILDNGVSIRVQGYAEEFEKCDTMIGITVRGKALSFCCGRFSCGRLREVVL